MTRPLEHCCVCDQPTGKAGIGDDSLYCAECASGPFCEACWDAHPCENKAGDTP